MDRAGSEVDRAAPVVSLDEAALESFWAAAEVAAAAREARPGAERQAIRAAEAAVDAAFDGIG